MRFKAKILSERVPLFSKIVATVQKISKDCVLHLSERKVQFILAAELKDGGVQVWSGINAASLFDDYILDSQNSNEIAFEINLDHLQRALKSAQNAQNIVVKLTKKNQLPYLSLAIDVQNNQHIMTIIQDVPITLLSALHLAQYTEPHLPDPEVHIMMPPLRHLRNVIEKMKNVSEHLTIEANMAGQLTFRVDTELVNIITFYKNLEHPQIEGRSPPRQNPDVKAEVKVDIKKFHRFLFSYLVGPTNVICCIVETRAVVLHVLLEDIYLTYYIPVISS